MGRDEPWVLEPHLCILKKLRHIEQLYKERRIPAKLYDAWMEANGGDYQLGTSDTAFKLWDAVQQFSEDERIEWNLVSSRLDVKVANQVWKFGSSADKSK